MSVKDFLWSEKYRPRRVADCILPDSLQANLQEMVSNGKFTSMIFHGSTGVGKTSAAVAMAEELEFDYLIINAALDNGIDSIRVKVMQFASSISTNGKIKMVIFDEGDRLTSSSQDSLKTFIEEYADNVVFIFTTNHVRKMIPALISRCPPVEFKIKNADKPKIAAKFSKRLCTILDQEGVSYTKDVVAKFLVKFFPDFRRTINELQLYSNNADKSIDIGILGLNDAENIKELVSLLKDKDFKRGRAWVAQNSDMETAELYRTLFESLLDKINEVPQMVIIVNDYQHKAAFVADQELNSIAAIVELMSSISFK